MELLDQNYLGTDNFNVAPTSNVWIIRSNPDRNTAFAAIDARWWLTPNWAKEVSTKYAMFNARAESLERSPAYKTPFKRKRCVVPISGYYEWQRLNESKRPHYIKPTEHQALILAGLWDEWLNPDVDQVITSFTVVTCEAAEPIKFLHHRQPVMLGSSDLATWLNPDTDVGTLHSLMRPNVPYGLEVVPVSNFVGNTRNNGPTCIEPTGNSQQIAALR